MPREIDTWVTWHDFPVETAMDDKAGINMSTIVQRPRPWASRLRFKTRNGDVYRPNRPPMAPPIAPIGPPIPRAWRLRPPPR